MSDAPKVRSPVPLVRQGGAEDFIHRLADLRAEAKARGYGTLAYFLDIAQREAMIQADQEADARQSRRARPDELWLPER